MKNIYIAPDMEIAELEVMDMLAASLSVSVSDEVTKDDAVMTNRHRGEWGDRWAD